MNFYEVKFVDYDGTQIGDTQTVEYGNAATAPEEPMREGHAFIGWDKEFTEITENLTVTAKYTVNTYTVTFVDHNNDELKVEEVEYGKGATAPGAPERVGYTFTGWDVEFDNVTEDITVTAMYEQKTYTVTFNDKDGQIIGEAQTVNHGEFAVAPEAPVVEGYTFDKWDKEFTNITENLTVTATYRDDEAPVLKYDGETEIIVAYEAEFTIPEVTATDNVDGTVDVNSVITDADSNVLESINTTVAGVYTITYSAVDAAGNKAEEIKISVLVAPVAKNKEKRKFYFDENNGLTMALSEAVSGDIVILLADHTLNKSATVTEGVTLLLPHDEEMSIETNNRDDDAGSAPKINRDNAYVELTMPHGIELNVNGVLTVNAKRAAGTPQAGFVTGKYYAQIHMEEGSGITVEDGGELNSIGFIYGEGRVEAKLGGTIYDSFLITDFRGGSITSNIFGEVFPFDQYSFHHIEVPITVNEGSHYRARTLAYAGGTYAADSDVYIIGVGADKPLINLTSGKIIKSYDTSTGKNELEFYGEAQVNEVTVNVYVDITTKDKEMPFPGNFQLNVKSSSTLNLNAGVKLLPGSGLTIEEGARFNIAENGRLMVYDADEYTQSRGYPMTYKNTYRVEPTYDHGMTTPAQFILNGDLEVAGKIAGKIHTENQGKIDITSLDASSINIGHVEGGGGITYTNYHLKNADGERLIVQGKYEINKDNSDWITRIKFIKPDSSNVDDDPIEQKYGEDYILPDWANDDSIFWYSEEDGGERLTLTKINLVPYNTVYARIVTDTKVVSFNTNGGEPINPYKVPTSSTIDPNFDFPPIKENAVFLSWYEDANFDTPYNKDKAINEDIEIYARWAENGMNIVVTATDKEGEKKVELVDGDEITIAAEIKDGDDNLLKGIDVIFSGGAGNWTDTTGTTDENGKVETTYKGINGAPNKTSILNETLEIIEKTSGKDISGSVKITVQADFSCPFVYSYDGEEYHFEHESIPFAVNKALETTSYGTFRKLKPVDGKYHVKVAEMLDEKSFVNGLSLTAVDYSKDSGIKEVFADIYGNPHTVKDRIAPVKYIDFNGNDFLEEVTAKDQLISSDYIKLYEGDYLTSFEATFNKPKDVSDMAKLMISTQKTTLITRAWDWLLDKVDGTKNMWWIENIMQLPEYQDTFRKSVDTINLRVELWDGDRWIEQGEIKAGRHLLEDFLVPIDLSIIDKDLEEVKVRFKSGAGFYEIDQVSIDFSEDKILNMIEIEPESVMFNEDEDVKDIVLNFEDNQYVNMVKGDKIDFVFDVPKLGEGHERGFMVALKGYYHGDPYSKQNPIVNEWDGLDFDGIMEALYAMEDENIIAALPSLQWLSELMEFLYYLPLEEKIKVIIVENVLPWINNEQ